MHLTHIEGRGERGFLFLSIDECHFSWVHSNVTAKQHPENGASCREALAIACKKKAVSAKQFILAKQLSPS
jgi:hypothetical protein